MSEKNWDVIDKKEPRGQSVTYKGIPCTARTCVTYLNRFEKENEQLKEQLSEQGTRIDFLKDENKHMRDLVNENKQLKQSFINLIDKKIEEFQNGDYGDLPCNTIHMFLDLKEELER